MLLVRAEGLRRDRGTLVVEPRVEILPKVFFCIANEGSGLDLLDECAQRVLSFGFAPEERARFLLSSFDAINDLGYVVDDELPALAGAFTLIGFAPIALA
ncbi:MAG: hypothetical protein WAK11_13085 [Candidatus Cybelea sp.]